MNGLLLLAAALLLMALRVNLILVLIFVVGSVHLVWGAGQLEYFVQDMWSAMDREIVLAVPLFILVGSVMSRGSIDGKLVQVMIELTRGIPGGLAVATILSCAVFSAISGSSIVTMLAVGAVLYPALRENGILTPPLGLNLIVAMTAFKEKFSTICMAALPFVALMILCLLFVTFNPWVALYLVR